jgi:hypothetical protein
MSVGPGKYDAECSVAQKATNAASVILIVLGGDRGDGFSVQATPEIIWAMPDMLREIAKQLEIDIPNMKIES